MRELGIRLALGAQGAAIFRTVVGEGMRPVAIGGAAGIAGAFAAGRLVKALLFGVEALDPFVYSSAIGVLALAAFLASALPALRATRVDPLVVLREE
jgi:ABC-type antimicrobial peptide transport system permease subunit